MTATMTEPRMHELSVTCRLHFTDQDLIDLFNTALEGGIGYWSKCDVYHWINDDDSEDLTGFHALIVPVENDTWDDELGLNDGSMPTGSEVVVVDAEGRVRIDGSTMLKGIQRALAAGMFTEILVPWGLGDRDNVDYDADVADVIVQMGLFAEVVYG